MVAAWNICVPVSVPVGWRFDTQVRLEGDVVGEVDQLLNGQRATVKGVTIDGMHMRGRALVRFQLYPKIHTDDRLSLRCTLKRPEPIEGFRYDRYLASRDVYATCSRPTALVIRAADSPSLRGLILRVKTWLVQRLGLALPDPSASFLSGLVFGGSSGLSVELQQAFSTTGTTHVLAASGSNVSLLTAVFLGWITQTRLGRKRGILLTGLLLCAYVVMAGAGAAVMRAALMAGVLLVGTLARRRAYTMNVLLAAMVLMLLGNPRLLTDDPGFQLSVVATLSLLTLAPHWMPYFSWMPEAYEIRSAFVTSLAASVATLPISLWHFGSISAIGPLANVLLLPFIPLLVGLGLIAFAAAAVHPWFGTWIGLPAWAGASLFLRLERVLAAVPGAQAILPHPYVWAALSAFLVLFLLWRSCRVSVR